MNNRDVLLYTKIFSENFCPVCGCLVSADMDLKNADEKAHTFSRRSKHGYCVNSPFSIVRDVLTYETLFKPTSDQKAKLLRNNHFSKVNLPLETMEEPRLMGLVRNTHSAGRPVCYFMIR